MSDNRLIGVFDSGLGGLTAVTRISEILPKERIIYFGDTARTPYGSKSINTIKKFAEQITDFLMGYNTKIIVIACNTVSATCSELLQSKYNVPVLGIIEPTAKYIAENINKDSRIGIIGTKVTIESGQYECLIHQYCENVYITSKSCPLFVPMIEEGIRSEHLLKEIIKYYLDDFIKHGEITHLVLGCTHYPLVYNLVHEIYPDVCIINPSQILAEKTKEILSVSNMLAENNEKGSLFYASDLSENFISMINDILPQDQSEIKFKNFDKQESQNITKKDYVIVSRT